jgi:uncharacterized protein YndB with AHSA1/START domain
MPFLPRPEIASPDQRQSVDTPGWMDARSSRLVLEMRRAFPAPASVVFAALTDANQLAKWFGPQGYTVSGVSFRARVGDSYRIEVQPPDGDAFLIVGEFRDVLAPSRLTYTFAYEAPDPDDVETVVELSLNDRGASTEVSLKQGRFKTPARRALHQDGWRDSFDKLERLIAQGS